MLRFHRPHLLFLSLIQTLQKFLRRSLKYESDELKSLLLKSQVGGGKEQQRFWRRFHVTLETPKSQTSSFFSSKILCNSSASSLVFTLINIGRGTVAFFSSMGGLGTQIMRTLFFPVLEHGILGGSKMFSNMLPARKEGRKSQIYCGKTIKPS